MTPLFPYVGGKTKRINKILPLIPRDEIETYAEPFCGGLSVLLVQEPYKKEIANDICEPLIQLYRHAVRCPDAVIAAIKQNYPVSCREEFIRIRNEGEPQTEIGRAARFYYLIRYSFGSAMHSYGICTTLFHGFKESRDRKLFHEFSERCKNTTFLNTDAASVIKDYDSEKTFFFLDPPYINSADTSYKAFKKEDMKRIEEALRDTKGRWILTCDNTEACREVFRGYRATFSDAIYSVSRAAFTRGRNVRELIVVSKNYDKQFPPNFESTIL